MRIEIFSIDIINVQIIFVVDGCTSGTHNCRVYAVFNNTYNIASRVTQSNSVYVSVLQISTVLADGVSKSLCQNSFSSERPLSARGKILYFATMMDTETRSTSPKTNTIFRPFLVS